MAPKSRIPILTFLFFSAKVNYEFIRPPKITNAIGDCTFGNGCPSVLAFRPGFQSTTSTSLPNERLAHCSRKRGNGSVGRPGGLGRCSLRSSTQRRVARPCWRKNRLIDAWQSTLSRAFANHRIPIRSLGRSTSQMVRRWRLGNKNPLSSNVVLAARSWHCRYGNRCFFYPGIHCGACFDGILAPRVDI